MNQIIAQYDALIEKKKRRPISLGFDVDELNPMLFPFQNWLVRWALRVGRAALFAECGLGKTPMQLEWAHRVNIHTGGDVLILCPLAVAAQTVREGVKFGIPVTHCRKPEDVRPGLNITNYERLEGFDVSQFAGVVLDESSILKSFDGATKTMLCEVFERTPFKLACTATPAPNDFDELGQHSEFLGWLSAAQMRATWFINDTSETSAAWRLKGHARKDFWRWVASWGACVGKPSDIGYPDDGYELPALHMKQHTVSVDYTEDRGEDLFRVADLSATNLHREMRLTTAARVASAAALVNESKEFWVVWCNTNYEADALKEAMPEAVEIRGNDKPDDKERKIDDFTKGKIRVLISKSSITGWGVNWQHCSNTVFVGLSYSFEALYQAVRRFWRFGQDREVWAHIVCAESEGAIVQSINRKIQQHDTMKSEMQNAAKELTPNVKERQRTKVIDHTKAEGQNWTLYHGDCVRGVAALPDASIHLSVFSPPFVDLFTYSDDEQDMGNSAGLEEFMEAFKMLVSELYRVTMPGRLCAVHCLDLMSSKWKDGEIGLKNFSGEIVDAFMERDWLFHSRVTIWKDPVVEMQRTKAIGLLHKQLKKDSAMSRTGNAEYVCVFRKPGVNPEPISHTNYSYPVELWQRDASPVWMDVRQGNVLNGKSARDEQDERHICPLQLDVIERVIRLWSNPGDMILSPFAGIASEGFQAIKMGRKFTGYELKESYWKEGQKYLEMAEAEAGCDLFELVGQTRAASDDLDIPE